MDDLQSGTRNKRGDWTPSAILEIAPFWQKPLNLRRILAWVPEYLWPWNAFHMATALLYWFFIIPDMSVMQTKLEFGGTITCQTCTMDPELLNSPGITKEIRTKPLSAWLRWRS